MQGDVGYIRVKPTNQPTQEDVEAFEALYGKYIKWKGMSKEYIDLLRKRIKVAEMQVQFVHTWKLRLITEINIAQAEIEALEANFRTQGMSIEQSAVYLSKWLGYNLNLRKISAMEYYLIVEEYVKGNKTE
jgi:hypothetical protein